MEVYNKNIGEIMKNLFTKTIALTVIITLAFLFTNCNDDDSNPASSPVQDENLIGKWDLIEAFVPSMNITVSAAQIGITLVASFEANSNYEMTTTDTTGAVEVETGTWSTLNGILTLKDSEGTEEGIPYSINGNVGILKSTYEIQPGVDIPADFKFIKQ